MESEKNFNDTAIRAARVAEQNPLYEPSPAAVSERVSDDDERHIALHLRAAKRPKVNQHSGVAKELTAWRESMSIKEAKYKTMAPCHWTSGIVDHHAAGAMLGSQAA